MNTLIKYFDKVFDDNVDVRMFIWVCFGGSVALVACVLAFMVDYAVEKEVEFFTQFPYLVNILNWKTLNLTYLLGVGLNLSLLVLYIRNSKIDFTKSYNNHLTNIKSLLLYTFLGYGGINLVIYPIFLIKLILFSFGKGIGYTCTKIHNLSSNSLEEIVVNIQKQKQES